MTTKLLLDALLHIKRHGRIKPYWAICYTVEHLIPEAWRDLHVLEEVRGALGVLAMEWSASRGVEYLDSAYWLGGLKEWQDEFENNAFWANPLRLDFLHFAIAQLEDELGVE